MSTTDATRAAPSAPLPESLTDGFSAAGWVQNESLPAGSAPRWHRDIGADLEAHACPSADGSIDVEWMGRAGGSGSMQPALMRVGGRWRVVYEDMRSDQTPEEVYEAMEALALALGSAEAPGGPGSG